MCDLWQDTRYALRSLAARPSFTITTVLTLALGLGVTTAVMSVVYTVVVAPTPYTDPSRLVQIVSTADGLTQQLPAAEVAAVRATTSAFGAIGVARFRDVAVSGAALPERVRGVIVTAETLPMLGVMPVLGRLPGEQEDRPGGPCAVVLSHRVWTDHFGAAPGIIGSDARLDGAPCTIMAVMPAGFAFPGPYFAPGDVWLLAGPSGVDWSGRAGMMMGFLTFGRLAPGAGLDAARAELDVISGRLAAAGAETGTRLVPVRWAASSRASSQRRLVTLLAAAALVLVIACVNVVNLQLARNVDRRGEIATRMALGASRGRLIRHLALETLALVGAGTATGMLIAAWSLNLITGLRSFAIPRMEEASLDGVAIGICIGLAILSGLAATLATSLRLSDAGAAHTMRMAGRGATAAASGRRFGRALVGVETTLALVLLAGAALLLESYRRSTSIELGFRTADMLHARVTPPAGRYADERELAGFYQRLHEAVSALPGARAVTLTNVPPGVGAGADQPFAVAGEAPPPAWPLAAWRSVADTYFGTLGMPVVRGDGFEQRRGQPRIAVVNEQFVRQYLPDRDPLGARLNLVSSRRAAAPEAESWTIVGVAADAREAYPHEPVPPAVYVRLAERPVPSVAILVRTAGPPLALSDEVRRAVASIDADQPVFGLRDMDYMVASERDLNRLSLTLLGIFAAAALALAIAGIQGVVAHAVGQRVREMAVRQALGARPSDVLWMIVGECARYAAPGAMAGLLLVFAMSGRLAVLTQTWAGTDARLIAAASILVLSVVLMAAYLPARRAAGVDPVTALRQD